MTPSPSADDFFALPSTAARPNNAVATLAPILIGVAFAVVALVGRSKAGRSTFGAWLRGFLAAGDTSLRDALRRRAQVGQASLPQLRHWLLGRSKAQVATRFGPPRTAVIGCGGAAAVSQSAFWRAETWYYAVDTAARTAMAITFDGDIARQVDFFDAPSQD